MQNNNQQNQTLNTGSVQPAASLSAAPSSSPWEEDLDLPEETSKSPTIIGSLGPVDVPNIKTLKVPGEIEEKVGKELKVNEVVGPKQVITPVSPSIEKKEVNIATDIVSQPNNTTAANTVKTEASTSSAPAGRPAVESIHPPVNKTSNSNLEEIDWFGGDSTTPVDKPVTGVTDKTEGVSGLVKPIDIKPAEMVQPIEPRTIVNDSPELAEQTDNSEALRQESTNLISSSLSTQTANQSEMVNKTDTEEGKIGLAKNKLANLNIAKIALSSLGSILMVLVLIIALNEIGMFSIGFDKVYGKIGLERIWGGLASNPKMALVQSTNRMKDQPNFKVKGSIDLKVDSTIKSDISDPLTSEDYGIEEMTSTLLFHNSKDTSYAELKLSNNSGESTLLLQNKGDRLYVKGDDQITYANESGRWAEFIINTLNGKVLQEEIYKLKDDIQINGERVGVEKIEGKNCYHYRVESINIGNGLEAIGITSEMVQSMEGDIWIGIKDKLITKVALRITTPVSTAFSMIEANLTFYDYGVINNIETISENLIESVGQREVLASETGDAKRKSDVAKIIKALEKYKIENGSFPNSNNQLVPLNTDDNIVANAIVPAYINELPEEENELFNWYYAYKSDGQKCSVSARLANSADPEAQLTGNLVLYIKYNSD